jgi:ABC-type multidrug transport system ATPase subunit
MPEPPDLPPAAPAELPCVEEPAAGRRFPFLARDRVAVGRSRSADVSLADLRCSRRHFELVRTPGGWLLAPLALDNLVRLNGKPVVDPVRLSDGDRIEAGDTVLVFRDHPGTGVVRDSSADQTVLASDVSIVVDEAIRGGRPFPVIGEVTIGRDPACNLVLSHPLVSRKHARLTMQPGGATLADLGSVNGTFVNGKPVRAPVALRPGDRIDVGPYTLTFTGNALTPASRSGNVELRAWGLTRTVKDRAGGGRLTILDNVSLVVRPGRFVCLLGPSGSGKSTLLAALSGRAAPDRGRVLVNAAELYGNFDAVKRDLVVVPQKDLMFDALTVEQALSYTARLRLPPDTSAEDLRAEVDELLKTVGLEARRHTRIRDLSGGQLKRVSLANELVGRPTLIFLDEVTSGLDEQTDRDMMDLFRRLADSGKTVLCVTHTMANVERACHEVVVLAPGGVLAFVGEPDEAKEYFGVERLGDVYEKLKGRPPGEWGSDFEKHPNHGEYTGTPPEDVETPPRVDRPGLPAHAREATRQAWVLFRRRLDLLLQDPAALLTLVLQTAVVAAALAVVFGDLREKDKETERAAVQSEAAVTLPFGSVRVAAQASAPVVRNQKAVTLYFLLGVSCFWFGCNGAVKVVVGDRPIYRRERAVNLSLPGYAASTFAVFCTLAVVQGAVLAGAVWAACHPPGMCAAVFGVLLLASAAGTALGLALSAASNSEGQAVAAVPLALIPQIVFGGAIAKLTGFALTLAKFGVACYWVHESVLRLLPDDVAGAGRKEPWEAVLAVFGHLVIYAAVAGAVVWVQDVRRRRPR